MQKPQCPCCASETFSEKFIYPHGPDSLAIKDRPLEILICAQCNSGFHWPPISLQSLLDFYKNEKSQWGDLSKTNGPSDFPIHYALALSRIEYIKKYISGMNLTMTDIGAGNGAMGFACIHSISNKLNTYFAQDLDNQVLQRLQEIWPKNSHISLKTAYNVSTEQLQNTNILCLSHVVEHMQNPAEELSKYLGPLKTGTLIFIEVPHLDFRFKKYPFPHLTFFSKNGIIQLANILNLKIHSADTVGGDWENSLLNAAANNRFKNKLERIALRARKLLYGQSMYKILQFLYASDSLGKDGPWLRLVAEKK